jgi:hypothetical protein
MVREAWSAASDDREKMAVLAAAGSGAFGKIENLYGYPAVPRFVVDRAPWAPADVQVGETWRGGVQHVQTATVSFAGDSIVRSLADGTIDFGHERENLAPGASAAFSSQEANETVGIADSKVGGYPGVRGEEWSTSGEKAGASVTLSWSSPRKVARVVLFDRINPNDQITSGTLTFSDGSSVAVGRVPNTPEDGPYVADFAARDVTWLRFEVTAVSGSTENIGIAELAVYGP